MKTTGETRCKKEKYRQKENAGHQQRSSRTFSEFTDGTGGGNFQDKVQREANGKTNSALQ